jgi:hypothetical protein
MTRIPASDLLRVAPDEMDTVREDDPVFVPERVRTPASSEMLPVHAEKSVSRVRALVPDLVREPAPERAPSVMV